MHPINLSAIDLNLLVTLEALLRERSVTRAARQIGLGQPATSHALARLRDLLGDPLLVREGRGLALTPRAEALAAPLDEALRAVRAVFGTEPPFDPRTTKRRFVLSCPDLIAAVLPELVAALAAAPLANLTVLRPQGAMTADLLLRGADVAVGATSQLEPGVAGRRLGEAAWATLCRPDHPFALSSSPDVWFSHGHVQVATGSVGEGPVDAAARHEGRERRVTLVVPSFLLAPTAVANSSLLFTGPAPFLRPLATAMGLVLRTPPLVLPPAPVTIAWPQRLEADPGAQWFRQQVASVVGRALESAAPGTTDPERTTEVPGPSFGVQPRGGPR